MVKEIGEKILSVSININQPHLLNKKVHIYEMIKIIFYFYLYEMLLKMWKVYTKNLVMIIWVIQFMKFIIQNIKWG